MVPEKPVWLAPLDYEKAYCVECGQLIPHEASYHLLCEKHKTEKRVHNEEKPPYNFCNSCGQRQMPGSDRAMHLACEQAWIRLAASYSIQNNKIF